VEIAEHIASLDRDGRALAEAAAQAGPDAEVPACPGWRVRDLVQHLGGAHAWAASFPATGRMQDYPAGEEATFFPTVDDADLVDWYRDQHAQLVRTLSATDPARPCWSFLPAPTPLAFWARRQAHETAIHRFDAESAAGHAPPSWTPTFAADGVDELMCGFFGGPGRRRLRADPPTSMTVVADDVDAAWHVRLEPERRVVVHGREPADLTVTGPANDLYLLLWNRAGTDALILDGDRRPLDLWRERATIRWS
jgi:uncharacterized protein (TIGR03083 family)